MRGAARHTVRALLAGAALAWLAASPGAPAAIDEASSEAFAAPRTAHHRDSASQGRAAVDWRDPWREPEPPAQFDADEYAWRLFVALNWPADPRTRAADPAARLGAAVPVVWESWLGAAELYRADGADPGAWLAVRGAMTPERRFEAVARDVLPNLKHVVAGVMVPVEDRIASARRLTEIHMNRRGFEFVRARGLYHLEGQLRLLRGGSTISFPYGTREVKAKWRPITEAERPRYHTLELTLGDGSRRLYGLTGLHVASKDLPTWLWMTFEHVDNPTLADNEGWVLPSRDDFSCRRVAADCNRAPAGIGLEGTVWQYYRLRGTLTAYTDPRGEPERLANSELESGVQSSASCITCHSRAARTWVGGQPTLREIFDTRGQGVGDPLRRRGYVGAPTWLPEGPDLESFDFVWSLMKAQYQSPGGRSHAAILDVPRPSL